MNGHVMRAVLCGLLVAAPISGCGKKGGLEPPPSSTEATERHCEPRQNPDTPLPVDATPEPGRTGIDEQMPDTRLPPC